MRLRVLIIVAALAPLVLPSPANAQSVGMSCSQAVATYERSGRITVTTRSGTTLPIYDGVPVSKKSTLRCPQVAIQVQATDNKRCVVAYKCGPRSHGGR